jgi:sulfatase maturation enzyme AslB (radical SAM superfamily)
MKEEVFTAALEKLVVGRDVNAIIFNKDGEPLLHPEIKAWIELAQATSSAKTVLYTNGLNLTHEFCGFLNELPNPVDLLITYHKYNVGCASNEDKYLRGFSEIEQVCRQMRPQNIAMSITLHETDCVKPEDIKQFKALWQMVKDKNGWPQNIHVNDYLNAWSGNVDDSHAHIFPGCLYGKESLHEGHVFVGVTGNITPCCNDLNEEIILANVLTDDRAMIFGRLEAFHKANRENEFKGWELCKRCLGNS